ncbi:MAG: V-type ATP synthase subunit F [Oscillospiraceae bacterium]|jgi:V/A-type H+-transporting ATPase subunit F|nr:V-type ATP synthase subunit F [Oscillospiraceae bacterium]
MLKIAVIGHRETVMGFKALGLEVFPAETNEQALEVFAKLTENPEEYAIIYIEESYAGVLTPETDKYKDSPVPAIILIPGRDGSLGLGRTALRSAVERAVGSAAILEVGNER